MLVKVKVFANLKNYARAEGLPGTPFELDLPGGSTLLDVVNELKIPVEEVKITFINGIAQALEHPLSPGDDIGIFPPIGGG
jgi:molybdopterin converting factor small subunit